MGGRVDRTVLCATVFGGCLSMKFFRILPAKLVKMTFYVMLGHYAFLYLFHTKRMFH